MSSIQKIFLGYSNYGYYDEEELMYEGCANIFDDDGFVFVLFYDSNGIIQRRAIGDDENRGSLILGRDPSIFLQERDSALDVVDGVRQGDQIVVKEPPPHHQQEIFLLHLFDQLFDLFILIAPHDECIGNQEGTTAVNGRGEILDDALFILSQQDLHPQVLLMQVIEQRCPVEAVQGGVKEIQIRLEEEQSADLAPFIEIAKVVPETDAKHQGTGDLIGDMFELCLRLRNIVKVSIQLVEILDMHKAKGICLLAEGELGQAPFLHELGDQGLTDEVGFVAVDGNAII